jgi:hypothetical protein
MPPERSDVAHEARDSIKQANRRVVRVTVAAVVFVVALAIGGGLWIANEIGAIRSAQARDTRVAQCEVHSLDNALYNAGLLVRRDANPHDYKPTPQC